MIHSDNNYTQWTWDLENSFGQFAGDLVSLLPEELAWIVFCSPLSSRDPEAEDIWHPFMRKGSFFSFLGKQLWRIGKSGIKGIIRFSQYRFGKFDFYEGESSQGLGICPLSVCKKKGNRITTTYCSNEDQEELSWIAFDSSSKSRETFGVSPWIILKCYVVWIKALVRAVCRQIKQKNRYWGRGLLVFGVWLDTMEWVHYLLMIRAFKEYIDEKKIKQVFCAHEMHPYARLAWIIAQAKGIKTTAIQHASIVRTKLWYFSTEKERQSGLIYPDEFFVFSARDSSLLRDYTTKNTCFKFACGPRFAHWQQVSLPAQRDFRGKIHVLFVTSLPWWDNKVVLQALRNLLEERVDALTLSLRLHPTAIVPRPWPEWIKKNVAEGALRISTGILSEAVTEADVVIGMNTTVLEEALLLGKVVLAVQSAEYLSFTGKLVPCISWEDCCMEEIKTILVGKQKQQKERIQAGRFAFAIDLPVCRVLDKGVYEKR